MSCCRLLNSLTITDCRTQSLVKSGKMADLTVPDTQKNFKNATEKGLLKILSKMGISLLSCYHGAQIFEIYGLGDDVVNLAFNGSVSRIGGLSIDDLQREAESFWVKVSHLSHLVLLVSLKKPNHTDFHYVSFQEVLSCNCLRLSCMLHCVQKELMPHTVGGHAKDNAFFIACLSQNACCWRVVWSVLPVGISREGDEEARGLWFHSV